MAPNKKSNSENQRLLANRASLELEDQNADSARATDQILLKALQEFIVPLIRGVDRKKRNDMNKIALGPEAGKLITALQEFISCVVVRSHAGTLKTIEVSLSEDQDQDQDSTDDDGEESDLGSSDDEQDGESSSDAESSTNFSLGRDTLEKPEPTFHKNFLKALREHIFNTMPIRLLSFEQRENGLQIRLLERRDIHSHLVSALREKMDHPEFRPIQAVKGEIETDRQAIKRLISKYARYAILSHTWLRTESGEVTYDDWNRGVLDTDDPGYQKLVNFCRVAWRDHGVTFGWMDTVCINKESSSELDESIRSMYNWYNRADVCIVYLAETGTLSKMHRDSWFTRGWTFQELLAPSFVKFYNSAWKRLSNDASNDKNDDKIMTQIERATTMSMKELTDIHEAPISRRMQLAANREVTREEDTAYSLMGIFKVSIATAYGEGAQRAFSRLLQEILASSTKGVLDVFNWAINFPESRLHNSLVLPYSPQCYLSRSNDPNLLHLPVWPTEPLTLTHLGLHVEVILMPALSIHGKSTQYQSIGDFTASVDVSSAHNNINTSYNLLDNRISGPDGQSKDTDWHQVTFAVFSFKYGGHTSICILKTCLAVCLECSEDAGEVTTSRGTVVVVPTTSPIVFELSKSSTIDTDDDNSDDENNETDASSIASSSDYSDNSSDNHWDKEIYYRVERDELEKHGMQLVILYL